MRKVHLTLALTFLATALAQTPPNLIAQMDSPKFTLRAIKPFKEGALVRGLILTYQGLTLSAPTWQVTGTEVPAATRDLNNDGKPELLLNLLQGRALGRYDDRMRVITVANGKLREVPLPDLPGAYGKQVQTSAGKLIVNGQAVVPFQLDPRMKFVTTDPKLQRAVPRLGQQMSFMPSEDARDEIIARVSVSIGEFSVGQLVTTLKLSGPPARGQFMIKGVTFEPEGPQGD